jgi:hypothetical protein
MPNLSNTNYNNISVKTDSMVKLIDQLAKLGVFKTKRKARRAKASASDEVKQPSDLVGYTRPSGDPNLFALRQIESGMTQQQIQDIQERNNASNASLRAELEQRQLEDMREQQRYITGLATAAAGRFAELQSGLENIQSDKFRPSEPIREASINPAILPNVETKEDPNAFTQTLNEGGPPEAAVEPQTQAFTEDDTDFNDEQAFFGVGRVDESEQGIPLGGGGQPLQPVERIFKEPSKFATPAIKKRAERAISIGLGPPPQARNTSEEIRSYYLRLANREDFEPDKNIKNARQYLKAIEKYLDEDSNFL